MTLQLFQFFLSESISVIITLFFALFVSQTIITIFLFEDYCSTSLFQHILFLLVSKRQAYPAPPGRAAGVRSPPTPTPKRASFLCWAIRNEA
jgi:hypothetical protein